MGALSWSGLLLWAFAIVVSVVGKGSFRLPLLIWGLTLFAAAYFTTSRPNPLYCIDQHTAFLLDLDGQGVAAGTGAVYFYEASKKPAVCRPGVPLTFAGISARKLIFGERFDVKAWSGDGTTYKLSVDPGAVRSTQPGGVIY